MNIELPNNLESAAEMVAAARGYESVTAYFVDVLNRDIESVEAEQNAANWQNTDEWRQQLREWAASHPSTDHDVDTDRDSIYPPQTTLPQLMPHQPSLSGRLFLTKITRRGIEPRLPVSKTGVHPSHSQDMVEDWNVGLVRFPLVSEVFATNC